MVSITNVTMNNLQISLFGEGFGGEKSLFYLSCYWKLEWLHIAHLNARANDVQRRGCIWQGKIAPGNAGEGTVPMDRRAGPHQSALEFNDWQPIFTPNYTTNALSLHEHHVITEVKFASCSLGIFELGCPNPATTQKDHKVPYPQSFQNDPAQNSKPVLFQPSKQKDILNVSGVFT